MGATSTKRAETRTSRATSMQTDWGGNSTGEDCEVADGGNEDDNFWNCRKRPRLFTRSASRLARALHIELTYSQVSQRIYTPVVHHERNFYQADV